MRSLPVTKCTPAQAPAAVNASWPLYVDGTILTVRRSSQHDLPQVAMMHNRCSAKSLLDRYRLGGRAPSVLILDRQLREPLGYVVTSDDGRIVATAHLSDDADHAIGCVEAGILVEDSWQRLGIGRPLLRHLAAAAVLSGYHQLVVYPGTATAVIQSLMLGVGVTRMSPDGEDTHLHTSLPQSVARGLGAMRAEVMRASVPVTAYA